MLSALVSCVEDTDDKVALEAITGVLKVVQVASEETVAPILVNICYRIRSGFDRNVTEMRAAAFKLFGALARFGQGGAALDQFYEHIHLNLPCLVLHVNDEQVRDASQCFALSAFSSLPSSLSFSRSCSSQPTISSACRSTLVAVAPLFGSSNICEVVNEWCSEGKMMNYEPFLTALSRVLIDTFPDRVHSYIQK